MNLIVVSGMSGAGKAVAAKAFEDLSFLVVDNLPPALLPDLVARCLGADRPADKLAVVVDSRSGPFFTGWEEAFLKVGALGVRPKVLFLDASEAVLVQRFKETRRKHPLFDQRGGVLGGIRAERNLLQELREAADKVIDTSELDLNALRFMLMEEFGASGELPTLTVTVASFGFKHGLPLDADLVFDVRFLVNPHYVKKLQPFDGRHADVEKYVLKDPGTGLFLERLYDLIDFSMPRYVKEGKAYLTVAIGCTGGRHRSVVVAEKLGVHLRDQGYRVLVQHRDAAK